MLLGFLIVFLAGVAYYFGPRTGRQALYGAVGNYLMAAGLVVYVIGRVLRWRGRPKA